MAANTSPIQVGTASANAVHSADLGRTVVLNGKTYRICKAGATIALAGKKVVVTAVASGAASHIVDVTTSTNNSLVYGVIPSGQTGSTGTTSLISGDYFPLQISGAVEMITNETTLALGAIIGTATAAGYVATNVLTTVAGPSAAFAIATISQTETTGTVYARISRLL